MAVAVAAERNQSRLMAPVGRSPEYIAPDPKDPDVLFAGGNNGTFMTRLNRRTGELREVNPYPGCSRASRRARAGRTLAVDLSDRLFSGDPNVLYTSSQHVWRTTNGGQSWDKISGDLTRHDPKDDGRVRWADHQGHEQPRGVRHRIRARARQDQREHPLGRLGRRAGARDAGWRKDLDQRHAEGDAGVRPRQPDRCVDFRSGGAYIAVKKPLLNDFAPYCFEPTTMAGPGPES